MKELSDLSVEISAVSAIVSGLSVGLDEDGTKLTPEYFKTCLFGVARYLDRIADDLGEF